MIPFFKLFEDNESRADFYASTFYDKNTYFYKGKCNIKHINNHMCYFTVVKLPKNACVHCDKNESKSIVTEN